MCLADFVTVFDTLYVIKSNHAIMPAARVKTQWDPQAGTAGGAASITDQPHIVLKLRYVLNYAPKWDIVSGIEVWTCDSWMGKCVGCLSMLFTFHEE